MKKLILVFVVTIFVGINLYSQTTYRDIMWDFFKNVIPKQKSITITGKGWKMVINDKYKVTFSGSWETYSNYDVFNKSQGSLVSSSETFGTRGNATFNGVGFVTWADEKIKIEMVVNASGSYETRSLSTKKDIQDWLQVTGVRDSSASGSTSINCVFDLRPGYKDGKFTEYLQLTPTKSLTLNMTGSTSRSATLEIGDWYTATYVTKSASELNSSANDEFGEWNWNTDRTRLFLKSQSSDNKFVILNNNGTLTWCMEIVKGAKGSSESTTDSGDKVVNLAMAFDGAPAQNFTFIENAEALSNTNFVQFDYVVYNRFLGTLDRNPETILNQIKEKQMLVLTYTVSGTQKTDMFILDGLTTILNYLKK
jgi:hypothetical protein